MASTLMAGLELARDGVARLHQEGAFAAITLSARAESAGDQRSAAVPRTCRTRQRLPA